MDKKNITQNNLLVLQCLKLMHGLAGFENNSAVSGSDTEPKIVNGLKAAWLSAKKADEYIMKSGQEPDQTKLTDQTYYCYENHITYKLSEEQLIAIEIILNEEGMLQKAKKSEYTNNAFEEDSQLNVLKHSLETEPFENIPILSRLMENANVTRILKSELGRLAYRDKIRNQGLFAHNLSWKLAKALSSDFYENINMQIVDETISWQNLYLIMDSLLENNLDLYITWLCKKSTKTEENEKETYNNLIRLFSDEFNKRNPFDMQIPGILPQNGVIALLQHILYNIIEHSYYGKKIKPQRLMLKTSAPSFLKNYLNNKNGLKDYYLSNNNDNDLLAELKIKVENMLNIFYRALGDELITFLNKNNFIYLQLKTGRFLTTVNKTNIKSVQVVTFNLKLISEISRHLPRYSEKNKKERLFVTNIKNRDAYVNHINETNKIETTTTLRMLKKKEKTRLDAIVECKKPELHAELFNNTYYRIDLEATYDFLLVLNKIIQIPQINHDILQNTEIQSLWNELYGINWSATLKKTPYKETLLKIMEFSRQFAVMGLYKKYRKKVKTLKVSDKKGGKKFRKPVKSFYARLINTIESNKFILNEILYCLAISLRFKYFNYDYFTCFRFRVYPIGAYNYMLPLCRYFTSFCSDIKTNQIIDQNTFNLLKEQVKHNLKDDVKETFDWTQEINYTTLNDKVPFGKLFETIKFCRDIKNITLKENAYFCGSYSLDCSSSGSQLEIDGLLQIKSLAEKVSLIGNKPTIYVSCMQHVKEQIESLVKTIKTLEKSENHREIFNLFAFDITCIFKLKASMEKLRRALVENNSLLVKILNYDNAIYYKMFQTIKDHRKHLMERCNQLLKGIAFSSQVKERQIKVVIETGFGLAKKKNLELNIAQKIYLIIQFMLVYESIKYKLELNEKWPLNKKTLKYPIMTHFYGSSSETKKIQIMDHYINLAKSNGHYLSVKDLRALEIHSKFLCSLLSNTLRMHYGPMSLLFETIGQLCKNKNFEIPKIETDFFSYVYKPMLFDTKKQRINKKSFWISKKTNNIDFNKLSSSTVANSIQALDAALLLYSYIAFKKNVMKYNLPKNHGIFMVHDRFFVHPIYASILKRSLKTGYIEIFKQKYLYKWFSTNPSIIAAVEKLQQNYEMLTEKDLKENISDTFVKH